MIREEVGGGENKNPGKHGALSGLWCDLFVVLHKFTLLWLR